MKPILMILMILGLTACGKADMFSSSSPPPGCEDTIADFDSKVNQINQQSTENDVIQILGVPNAISSGAFYYFTGGCNTYKIQFSGRHVYSVQS